MKYLVMVSILLASACSAPVEDDEWQILFDGTDLSHWRNYQNDNLNPNWTIEGDVLTLTKGGGGDIITKDQYTSFELSLEWRISEGGNSGVFFHVVESSDLSAVYFSGPEFQILDNKGRSEPPLEQAGALFALYAPSSDYTKPVGEFNSSRIIVDGEVVEHWLNGYKVVSYTLGSEDFNTKVEASKFGNWPTFAAERTGHIALQDHGDVVGFRNIKIRRISP